MPFALIALVLVPAIADSLRLVEPAGGPHVMPANPRITASPLPVVVHILCAVPYAVLGAFQFSSGFRRRRPGWHRASGSVAVGLGLAVAFSALRMTHFYPASPAPANWRTYSGSRSGMAGDARVSPCVRG